MKNKKILFSNIFKPKEIKKLLNIFRSLKVQNLSKLETLPPKNVHKINTDNKNIENIYLIQVKTAKQSL